MLARPARSYAWRFTFYDLIHAKPLKKEVIEGMYSLLSIEIAAKKGFQIDKPALFEKIHGSPPLQSDLSPRPDTNHARREDDDDDDDDDDDVMMRRMMMIRMMMMME